MKLNIETNSGRNARLDTFMAIYTAKLTEAIENHPDEYAYPVTDAPAVAERMKVAIVKGTYNHDGFAFRNTCKALKIKHTRKAIAAYLAGETV